MADLGLGRKQGHEDMFWCSLLVCGRKRKRLGPFSVHVMQSDTRPLIALERRLRNAWPCPHDPCHSGGGHISCQAVCCWRLGSLLILYRSGWQAAGEPRRTASLAASKLCQTRRYGVLRWINYPILFFSPPSSQQPVILLKGRRDKRNARRKRTLVTEYARHRALLLES
jgi:hypothetical protein